MKKNSILLVGVLLMSASCDQSHLQQAAQVPPPGVSEFGRALQRDGNAEKQEGLSAPRAEASQVPHMDALLEGRKKMVPAISAAFARRTTPERAQWLAEICYEKTQGTQFSPVDLAEIALAETGGYKLSSRAVSSKGAMGVWQLMPERARSHGFSPSDMRDDEKCAEAAVLELTEKLEMAKGNKARAKRFYCGMGPAARAYDKVRRRYRSEILHEMQKAEILRELVRASRWELQAKKG